MTNGFFNPLFYLIFNINVHRQNRFCFPSFGQNVWTNDDLLTSTFPFLPTKYYHNGLSTNSWCEKRFSILALISVNNNCILSTAARFWPSYREVLHIFLMPQVLTPCNQFSAYRFPALKMFGYWLIFFYISIYILLPRIVLCRYIFVQSHPWQKMNHIRMAIEQLFFS